MKGGLKMKIEIMGTGCAKCKQLFKLVNVAVAEMGVEAEVVKVEDMQAMMDLGVMITPALFINGVAISAGRIPKMDELKRMITESA